MGQEIGISTVELRILPNCDPCLLPERLFYKGVTSWSKAMRKAPVRTEPHPTSPIALVIVIDLRGNVSG
jgi:hypothetical protein